MAMLISIQNSLFSSFYSEGGGFSIAVTTPKSACATHSTAFREKRNIMRLEEVKAKIEHLLENIPEDDRAQLLRSQLAQCESRGQSISKIVATKLMHRR